MVIIYIFLLIGIVFIIYINIDYEMQCVAWNGGRCTECQTKLVLKNITMFGERVYICPKCGKIVVIKNNYIDKHE